MLETIKIPFLRRTYDWFVSWANKPHAERSLFGFSLLEAIIFPIPPDPLLIAMIFSRPNHWRKLVLITLSASLIGAVVGYLFGIGLFESVGQWIIDKYHLQSQFDSLGMRYATGAFWVIITAAFTPIPFKLVTITAGVFHINFLVFILASALGRSARFFGVGYLANYLGAKHKDKIERYMDAISLLMIMVILLFVYVFQG